MKKYWTYTECYVKELYEHLGIFSPEQLDLKALAKKLDVKIFYWEEKSQAIIYVDMCAIFIDLRNSFERQWQDFCHELAHVLLHTGIQTKIPQMYVEYQEHKANQFMYHAAIPTFMLDNLNINDCTLENVRLVQQLFHVEEAFAIKRLNQYIQRRQSILNWNSLLASE